MGCPSARPMSCVSIRTKSPSIEDGAKPARNLTRSRSVDRTSMDAAHPFLWWAAGRACRILVGLRFFRLQLGNALDFPLVSLPGAGWIVLADAIDEDHVEPAGRHA